MLRRVICAALAVFLGASDCLARGGGAGGFHGGAGGFAGGGGMARPAVSPAYNRSPSMSRPAPVAAPAGRPLAGAAQYGNVARPNPTGGATRPTAGQVQRPTQGQLQNFLDMPGQGGRAAPAGRVAQPSATAAESRTIDGPHGGSATIVHGSGSKTLPSGATVEGGGAGVVVHGPEGGTHVAGTGGVEASKGDRSIGAAGTVHGTQTPGGVTTGRTAGVRAATGPAGTVATAHRGAAVVGPGGSGAAVRRGVTVAGGGVIGPHVIAHGQVVGIRNGFHGYGWYWTPAWYRRYPGAWFAAGVAVGAWWAAPAWAPCYAWCGGEGEPVTYNYGTNITIEGDTVYYDERPIATTDQYYEQAAQVAGGGSDQPQNEEWLPLGVFSVVSEGQTKTDRVLQLAVNKEGVIRGNLHDAISDKVIPLVGAVDKATQRVAFRPVDNQSVVAECGLWNLTQDTLPLLIHFDKDRVEERSLVRLTPPEGEQGEGS